MMEVDAECSMMHGCWIIAWWVYAECTMVDKLIDVW